MSLTKIITADDLLKKIVSKTAKRKQFSKYQDPGIADGACETASMYFLQLLEEEFSKRNLQLPRMFGEVDFISDAKFLGTNGRYNFMYHHAPHHWYLYGCRWPGHVVARVDDVLIDWTARQFHPLAPFPLIFKWEDINPRVRRQEFLRLKKLKKELGVEYKYEYGSYDETQFESCPRNSVYR